MGKRVTVVIDDDLLKKLRNLQSNLIKESERIVSFSRVINLILNKGIENNIKHKKKLK